MLGDKKGARNCFLVASILATGDVDAWLSAAALSDPMEMETIIDILATAYRYNDKALLDQIGRLASTDEEALRGLVEGEAVLQALAHADEPFTMRFRLPDGSIQEIPIGARNLEDD